MRGWFRPRGWGVLYLHAVTQPRLMICPYCGHAQRPSERCQDCATPFAASSRRATLDQMGPWFVRDLERPFRPGCSHETLVRLVEKGVVGKYTIVRGPTTRQLWTVARHVPGLAHLLGYCHACDAPAHPTDAGCHHCGATFATTFDRDALGLVEVDRDAASAPGRSVGFVPPVRDRVSSFAPDEEIVDPRRWNQPMRGSAAVDAGESRGAADDGAGPPAGVGTSASLIRTDMADGVIDAAATGRVASGFGHSDDGSGAWLAVERSLRYELRRQRTIIRTMGASVLLVAAIAGWLGWKGWHAGRASAGAASVVQPTVPAGNEPGSPSVGTTNSAPGASRDTRDASPTATRPVTSPAARSSDGFESIEGELLAISESRSTSTSVDQRRAQLDAIQQRLEGRAASDPSRAAAIRTMLDRVRAKLELEAALGGVGDAEGAGARPEDAMKDRR